MANIKIKKRNRVTAQVTAALTSTKLEPQNTIFRIPKEDEAVIAKLRSYLNSDDYTMRVRFRGPRNGYVYHTKKANARWFAIYITKRK